ncbi:NitT/TauT family transport system permease protein [Pseudomonas sp. NFACC23-1]|uniref:ABC transporter permease n=1 Tax=unclassified Pseudomonas TaxID=196821 RepID=UPI0008822F39|nr:NitT/TauT family transport system permease protein [Pseudomonas sp. NFACC17-2]SEI78665.1 NitT/TauT family transport system permease protein [Pseudomonas sp. NFACC23-1]SFW90979.1 NitT/TauT family transport system permease protein [Pseudomonas sp. NFACC16-2]
MRPSFLAPVLTPFKNREQLPANSWRADIALLGLLVLLAAFVFHGLDQMNQPLGVLDSSSLSLDLVHLPEYTLRTTLRMFIALFASFAFSLIVATLAAKSRKAAIVILPVLDILQSVPVLGFLTFTVVFFMGLFPGKETGVECAAIFAIFTSQVWNMTFSFYQSLRTVPNDLYEVSRQFAFSPWQRFIRLELPFATPGLVWNMMMSMSGGWFFVVASEAITVGDTTVSLPGIGSWLALAIEQQNIAAIAWAVLAMVVVIIAYDLLFFRPIVAWADKFRFEQTASQKRPRSRVYDLLRSTRLVPLVLLTLGSIKASLFLEKIPRLPSIRFKTSARVSRAADLAWLALVAVACIAGILQLSRFIGSTLGWEDVASTFGLGLVTLVRVGVLIVLASLVWMPIGVWIGLNPRWAERLQPVAQLLAAFPANVLFPFAVIAIVALKLNPDIWLSPLMILGTQWYILFNVIAGASALPTDLREAARSFHIRGWQWWRQVALPGVFPYYVTGALTAAGGSWNASIVAEAVSWGDHHLYASGLGSFIAQATTAGDLQRVALGVVVMSIFVVGFNRLLWRPLYGFAERRLRID